MVDRRALLKLGGTVGICGLSGCSDQINTGDVSDTTPSENGENGDTTVGDVEITDASIVTPDVTTEDPEPFDIDLHPRRENSIGSSDDPRATLYAVDREEIVLYNGETDEIERFDRPIPERRVGVGRELATTATYSEGDIYVGTSIAPFRFGLSEKAWDWDGSGIEFQGIAGTSVSSVDPTGEYLVSSISDIIVAAPHGWTSMSRDEQRADDLYSYDGRMWPDEPFPAYIPMAPVERTGTNADLTVVGDLVLRVPYETISDDPRLQAFDVSEQSLRWEIADAVTPQLTDEQQVIGRSPDGGAIVSYATASGDKQWEFPLERSAIHETADYLTSARGVELSAEYAVYTIEGRQYGGSRREVGDLHLVVIDRDDGTPVIERSVPYRFESPYLLSDGYLFIGAPDHEIIEVPSGRTVGYWNPTDETRLEDGEYPYEGRTDGERILLTEYGLFEFYSRVTDVDEESRQVNRTRVGRQYQDAGSWILPRIESVDGKSVRVRVERIDGEPITGVRLRGETGSELRTDENGIVEFEPGLEDAINGSPASVDERPVEYPLEFELEGKRDVVRSTASLQVLFE